MPLVLRLLLLEDELEDHWQHVEPLGAEDRLDVAHERLVVLLVNALSIGQLVMAEQRSLSAGASVSVGHAAHLTGFAWGVGVYLARLGWRRWVQMARSVRPRVLTKA